MKGALDRASALLGVVLLSPIILSVAALVWSSLGRPVLFRQQRPGLHGRPFDLLKFRTMREGVGSDEERLTRIGRFLRSWSLDELPELWNVLRGDMSLVGPRPLLTRYLPRYSPRQARRHEVKPGLTGWAQVNGRNVLTWDEKFELDVWYVDNWSIGLDLSILAGTVVQVLRREGISHGGSATMVEFTGSVRSTPRPETDSKGGPMTRSEFLRKVEDIMEIDAGSLNGGELLADLEAWDSLKVVEFLAMADEQFSVAVAPKSVAACKSVEDLRRLLGEHVTP